MYALAILLAAAIREVVGGYVTARGRAGSLLLICSQLVVGCFNRLFFIDNFVIFNIAVAFQMRIKHLLAG